VDNGLPDQEPVGTITNLLQGQPAGNSVVEDIGAGRFVAYGHV
jgi:hypothetical protein